MPRKVVDKTSFLGGEVGPLAEGRSDLPQHQLGATKIRNFVALPGGQLTRRAPTRFAIGTANNKEARQFIFREKASAYDYLLVEVTKSASTTLTIRVLSPPLRGASPSTWSVLEGTVSGVPTTAVMTMTVSSSFSIATLQAVQYGPAMFFTGEKIKPFLIRHETSGYTYKYTGSATNTNRFVREDYVGTTRSSREAWFSVPYIDPNITATTLSVSSASVGAGVTLTSSPGFFESTHVGSYFRINGGSADGYVVVTGVTNATTATCSVLSAIDGTGSYTNWSESAWGERHGWPVAIARYGQRMVFGGNTSFSDTVWLSEAGDVHQMSKATSGIDDPLSFVLDADTMQSIKWMHGGKRLTIGTDRAEWVGSITDDGTNLFVAFNEEAGAGSLNVQPVKVGHSLVFSSSKCLTELAFNFDYDSYTAINLNILADHVKSVSRLTYQDTPFGVVWVVDSDGSLFGLTRDSIQKVAIWHSHGIGGESVTVCDAIAEMERLHLVVKRTINGTVTYTNEYIEFSKPTDAHPTLYDEIFLDSFVTDDEGISSEKATWSAIAPHLASTTAYAVGVYYPTNFGEDGQIVHNGPVSVNGSGDITLNAAANEVWVGLHADAIFRPLPAHGGEDPQLHAMGVKRTDKISLRLYQTMGLKVGKNRTARQTGWEENTTFEPIKFDMTQTTDTPTFSGLKEVPPPADSDQDGTFALAMQDPWPCTILSIASRVVASEV